MTKKVTRAILLNKDNKVLLGKRMRNRGVGQWALVGGKPDGTESPEEAVIREVREELGVVFTPRFFKEIVQQLPGEEEPWRVTIFSGPFEGVPQPKPDEISEIMYVGKEDFARLDIAFRHGEILEEFFG